MMKQARSVEEECYMFAGAEELGLSCSGCKHETHCGTEEVVERLKGTFYEGLIPLVQGGQLSWRVVRAMILGESAPFSRLYKT